MPEKKTRCIAYIRVSTDRQAEEGFSLENQEKDIRKECDYKDWELVDLLADEGISGASLNQRDALQEALYRIKTEDIDYLIVWKISRLSRKVSDVVKIADLLDRQGSFFYSIKDSIDTANSMGKHFLTLGAIFAEMELDNLRVQVKGGMAEKARQGRWNGGSAPYGYDLVNKELIINEEAAANVVMMYEMYLKGSGYKAIAEKLNSQGFATNKNKPFSTNSIKTILMNIIYAGKIRWGKIKNWSKKYDDDKRKRVLDDNIEIFEGIHEAIVTLEMYDKVQRKIEGNPRRHMKQFGSSNKDNILSGLLRCPECGQGLSVNKGSKDTYYYVCNQYANKGKDACNINSLRLDSIEVEFFEIFDKILTSKEFEEKLDKGFSKHNSGVQEIRRRINHIEKQITTLRDREEDFIDEYMNAPKGRLRDKLNERVEAIGKEVDEHVKTINDLRARKRAIENTTVNITEVVSILKNAGILLKIMSRKSQKDLLRNLIESIETEDKHISKIHFKFDEAIDINNVDSINFRGEVKSQSSEENSGIKCNTDNISIREADINDSKDNVGVKCDTVHRTLVKPNVFYIHLPLHI